MIRQKGDVMKRIFFDLDGTLAEWKEADMRELKSKGYFLNLSPQKEILDFARRLANKEKFEVYILSAFLTDCTALEDKNMWCDMKAPEIKNRNFVLNGTNKALSVMKILQKKSLTDEDILVDDYSKNLNEWKKYGGKAIKWLNGKNGRGLKFDGPRTGDVDELAKLISSAA